MVQREQVHEVENDPYVVAKTERKLVKDPGIEDAYQKVVEEYLEKYCQMNMHKPQNGCFPTFLFCDLTGIRRRQELSFMPRLNFGGRVKTAKHCLDQNCRQTS